ncbi:MAG TPA: permease [Atribacterota bacterium]|nr:permease [Atribacterota bacterium]
MWFAFIAAVLLILSFCLDRPKTKKAVILAYKRFIFILPSFLIMLILISVILFLFPQEKIIAYLNYGSNIVNIILAALIGSITAVPGFIAFPLAGILKEQGISYTIIASFTTTLMMVGTITFPVETTYLGKKVALIRNVIGFVIAIVVALLIGLYFGEIVL